MRPTRGSLISLCLVAAATCLVVALMQPQWGQTQEDVPRRGRDLVVMLDTSLSMLAEDPQGLDAIAEVDTVTIEVDADSHFELFEDNFNIMKVVAGAIAGQMIDARRQIAGTAGFGEPAADPTDVPDRPLDLVERMSFIRRTMTFAEAKIDAIVDLAREAKEVRLAAGAPLWRESCL